MLHLARKVRGAVVRGRDGEAIGTVDDFRLDDSHWQVQYLVIDMGRDQFALITPNHVVGPWNRAEVGVDLTRADLRIHDRSEPFASDAGGLRSAHESVGYHVHATDGEIGHVDDLLIDESDWSVEYLLLDTSNWPGGQAVVVSTEAVLDVNPEQQTVRVNADRERVRRSPSFESIERAVNPGEAGPPFTII